MELALNTLKTCAYRFTPWMNDNGYLRQHTTQEPSAYSLCPKSLLCVAYISQADLQPSAVLVLLLSRGNQCSASQLDEAKRWFEAATVICRFVPGGNESADKVRVKNH